MLQRLISASLALILSLSPVAASSQDYMFRYRMPVEPAPISVPEPDFDSGNDIQAWFVAAVGYPFLKEIPVATKDVAEWTKDSGELPWGIAIESTSGTISGSAEREEQTETVWYGLDAEGNRIARAQMHFDAFEPVGQVSEVNWYTHTGEYFYSQIPAPAGIEVVRWDPIVDNPAGMATRNGAFEGRPPAAGTFAVAWRGYDYLDREVAFTYGEFLVQDGPEVEFIEDQVVDKGLGESFDVRPEVKHSIGTLTYALKPVAARPSGLTFEALDGSITGVYQTFDTSAKFVIEARDSGSGRTGLSNEFSLATLPETLDLTNMPDLEGVVGRGFNRRIAGGTQNLTFDLSSGTLPSGIDLTTETFSSTARGLISGVPTTPETQDGLTITASGAGATTVTSNPFRFRVFSGPMEVATDPLHVRVGRPFKTASPVVVEGQDPPYEYRSATTGQMHLRAVSAGINFDPSDGTYSSDGISEAGTYDQRLVVTNQSDRARAADQIIRVYNELDVKYEAQAHGSRLSNVRIDPILAENSVRAPARFALASGSLPPFLKLDPSSGVISGRPTEMSHIGSYGPFTVSLVDGFNEAPVLSNSFTIQIEDRPDLEIRQVSSEIQRFVENQRLVVEADNVYEGVTFTISDRGNLPSTLNLSSWGHLLGTTDEAVGTVYNFKIHAVDGVGYTADMDVSVTVIEPKGIGSIDGGYDRVFTWTKGRDFIGFKLPRVTNTYGTVTYTLGSAPFALSIDQTTLALTGNAPEVGTYTVTYTVSDQTTRAPVTGTLTFVIQDDMTVSQSDVTGNRGSAVTIAPQRVNGIAPFTWEIVSGTLPATGSFPAMTFDPKAGTIAGKPREEGSFPLTIRVTDATGQQVDTSFTLTVDKPLPFSFSFGEGWMTYGRLSGVGPTFQNKSEGVDWSFVSGTKPEGVTFHTSGIYAGTFRGYPRQDGIFKDILIKGIDRGTGEDWTENVTLKVRRTGDISMPKAVLKHRAGASVGKFAMAASNVTLPVVYELVSNPYGDSVSIDPATGELSVSFPDVGRRTVSVKVTDLFDRTHTQTVMVDILGAVELSSPSETAMKQYRADSVPLTAKNLIGTATYVLAGGTLPQGLAVSGAVISGTPELAERQDGLVVTVTDSYDASTASTAPFKIDVADRDALAVTAANYEMNRYKAVSFKPSVQNQIGTTTWELDPSASTLPAGLSFSTADGSITGVSDDMFEGQFTVKATDSKGGDLGSDEKTFTLKITERAELTVTASDYERNRYRNVSFRPAASNAVGGVTWELTPTTLPAGLVFDPSSGSITGVSDDMFEGQFTVKATDSKGGDLGTDEKTFTLKITERVLPEIANAEAQTALLNHGYVLTLGTRNVLGTASWAHVGGTLPDGVSFDPATATFSGTPTKFASFPGVVIELTDTFKGISTKTQKTFTFDVKQDGSPIGLTLSAESGFRVGEAFATPVPAATNTVGNLEWSATGLDGTGLSIDPSTGVISGTPTASGEITVVVTVTDATGREKSSSTKLVVKDALRIVFPTENYLTYNYRFDGTTTNSLGGTLPAVAQPEGGNVYGTPVWSISPAGGLPYGLTFNAATGEFVGQPLQLGQFGPFTITLKDSLPGEAVLANVFLDVSMNDDPIDLAVQAHTTKIGYAISTAPPAYGNELGDVTFFPENNDLAGTSLKLDPDTGVLTGVFDTPQDRSINIAVSDEYTTRVTSRPLHLQVLPLLTLTGPETALLEAQKPIAPVVVTPGNVAGTLTWQDLDQAQKDELPEGITFDTSSGSFTGQTDEIGTFGPFTVKADDAFHGHVDTGTSNGIVLDLRPGSLYMNLKVATLADGTKRVEPYSHDFITNLDYVGISESSLRWTWKAAAGSKLPPGLSLANTTGVLSGTPKESGSFAFDVTVTGGGRTSTKTFTLDVVLPEISLELTGGEIDAGERGTRYAFDLKEHLVTVNIPEEDIGWDVSPTDTNDFEVAGLPDGISLDRNTGLLSGIPSAAGRYRFTVKAEWSDINPTPEHKSDEDDFVVVVNGKTYTFKQVASGYEHTCALSTDGGVFCWGKNSSGQLGTGDYLSSTVPVAVQGLPALAVSLATGFNHSCAVLLDGTAMCWGEGNGGQLGNGIQKDQPVPVPVMGHGTDRIMKMSLGSEHSCSVAESGRARCWGMNRSGQLGNGNTTFQLQPVTPQLLQANTTDISAGQTHTCVVNLGRVKCFGAGSNGQLGDGRNISSSIPVIASYITDAVSVSAGSSTSCAITSSGSVMCWGVTGVLLANKSTISTVPSMVIGLESGARSISSMHFTCVEMDDGSGRCWGNGGNSYGRFGNGGADTGTSPATVSGLDGGIRGVAAGMSHACALTESGAIQCWGRNNWGQLGNNTTVDSLVPVNAE